MPKDLDVFSVLDMQPFLISGLIHLGLTCLTSKLIEILDSATLQSIESIQGTTT